MTSDESMIINNMLALLQELKQTEEGGESKEDIVEEQLAETSEDLEPKKQVKMEEDEEEDKEDIEKCNTIKKEIVETKSDGKTANDKAEDRVEVNEISTEEAVQELSKNLIKILRGATNNTVKKAKPTKDEIVFKTLKLLSNKLIEQEKALNGIFKGLGISETIINMNKKENENNVQKGMNNVNDINKSLEYIISKIDNNKNNVDYSEKPIEQVRKTLGNPKILKAMMGLK